MQSRSGIGVDHGIEADLSRLDTIFFHSSEQ